MAYLLLKDCGLYPTLQQLNAGLKQLTALQIPGTGEATRARTHTHTHTRPSTQKPLSEKYTDRCTYFPMAIVHSPYSHRLLCYLLKAAILFNAMDALYTSSSSAVPWGHNQHSSCVHHQIKFTQAMDSKEKLKHQAWSAQKEIFSCVYFIYM